MLLTAMLLVENESHQEVERQADSPDNHREARGWVNEGSNEVRVHRMKP